MNQPYELDFIKTNLKRKVTTSYFTNKKQEVSRKRGREKDYTGMMYIFTLPVPSSFVLDSGLTISCNRSNFIACFLFCYSISYLI